MVDTAVPTTQLAATSIKPHASGSTTTTSGHKENSTHDGKYDHDAEDDDEFFDAEDASLDGITITDGDKVLDHDAVN